MKFNILRKSKHEAPPPKLNPLAAIALRRYRDELTRLPFSPATSEAVDCIDRIFEYAGVEP